MSVEPESTPLTIDGIRIATRMVGERGPLAVWIHGLGGASTITFADVAARLAGLGIRSLLIDLPGYGSSDKPEDWSYRIEDQASVTRQVLDMVSDAPVTLIGHSMGGSIAIDAASRSTELVSRLIVAEPNLDPGVGEVSVHIARQSERNFVERGYVALLRAVRSPRSETDPRSTWPQTLAMASPLALHRSARSLLAERSPTFRARLEGLTMPVLSVSGGLTPPVDPPLINPRIQQAVIPNAGHEMWVGQEDTFPALIARSIEPE